MSNMQQLQVSMPESTFELFKDGFMEIPEIERWTLVGGTALAIHYQHRLSEDLDFFIKNSTLEQDRKRIDRMMERLEADGFEVIKIQENDTQIDFEINDVKVTFFASSLDILQQNRLHFGSVAVAGTQTIKTMKMDAILNHRTLSRDFFDIATIMDKEKITIFNLLESYWHHYSKKFSGDFIIDRLIKRELDPTDPGLTAMKPKESVNISKFRKDLALQIERQVAKDTKTLSVIIDNPSLIKNYLDRKFGLERMSLPQKLAILQEDELVIKALEAGDFDIAYKDISGKTILDHYLDNEVMFAEVLKFAKEIPNEWLQSRKFKSHGKDQLIALENSIISCARNKNNSNEKIGRIANKHDIDLKALLEKIEGKEKLLEHSAKSVSKAKKDFKSL